MRRLDIFLLAAFFSFTNPAIAQRRVVFEFGVRAGVPVNKTLESPFTGVPGSFTVQQSFKKPAFTVGPAFGAVLYDRVLVQFDALYKPVRLSTLTTIAAGTTVSTTRAASWEFPLVFDYRFFHGNTRPYAGGGMVLGQILDGTTESVFLNRGTEVRTSSQFAAPVNQLPAYVTNAGIEWNASRAVIRPELRYTRWDDSKSSLRRRRDQFEFVIGFSVRQ